MSLYLTIGECTAALVVVGIAVAVIAGKFLFRRKAQREIRARIDLERQDAVSLLIQHLYSMSIISLSRMPWHLFIGSPRRSRWSPHVQRISQYDTFERTNVGIPRRGSSIRWNDCCWSFFARPFTTILRRFCSSQVRIRNNSSSCGRGSRWSITTSCIEHTSSP